MKKKMKGVLFAALLAVAGLFGTSAAVINKQVEENPVVEKVNAETWVQNPTIYFVPSDNWKKDSATFKMNYYDNTTYKGSVRMSKEGTGSGTGLIDGRDVWKGVVSDGTYVSRIQICRMDSNYSGQWNYSGQILISDNNTKPLLMTNFDLILGDGWTTNTSGVWFNVWKGWRVQKTTDYSPSSSTCRVFFNNSGTHWADNTGTNKGCAVYAWGGDASPKIYTSGSATYNATLYNLTWINDDNGMSYGYADIPISATNYKFVRVTSVDDYTTDTGYFSDNQFDVDSVAYVRYGRTSGNYIDTGGAKDDVAGANLMKAVIQAYDTCGSSVLNGYGAYSALNTNFYSHATAAAKSATEKSLNGNTTTIENHFMGMASRQGGRSSSAINRFNPFTLMDGDSGDNATTIIIIIASSISLLSITALSVLLVKKRKNKEQ